MEKNARAGQHQVTSRRDRAIHHAHGVIVTLLAVASWAYAATTLQPEITQPQIDPRIERMMLGACKMPSKEGEMTAFAVVNGKLTCWRMT